MVEVVIPTLVFPEAQQPGFDQKDCVQDIVEAGAQGIEIREELFQTIPDLSAIKKACDKQEITVVYSSPSVLWKEGGAFNTKVLEALFKKAEAAGANYLKVSLGHFDVLIHDLQPLKNVLEERPPVQQKVQLLVENDQTLCGGRIGPLKHFFETVSELSLPVKMTFDTGNWLWAGEDGREAFKELKDYVGYLHLKGAKRKGNDYYAQPLDDQILVPWEDYLSYYGSDILCAIEFQVNELAHISKYVQLVKEAAWEEIS